MSDRGALFVKWGGSLITDKRRPMTARPEVLRRLAAELAALTRAWPGRVILGHGSGSFGHTAAREHGIAEGVRDRERLAGVGLTQDQAARLHRMVVAELLDAGLAPFSVAPGSVVVAHEGRPRGASWEVVWRALDMGLLPVVHGDVVLDRERGTAILSTERVFADLARDHLRRRGVAPRIFWLGDTDGVWGPDGERVPLLELESRDELTAAVGGAAGTDVTGGMRHRLEIAFELLDLGVESWILDGRTQRVVERVVGGEALGTRVGSESSAG